MARKNTIRLLLVNASDNDSERLVSLFRGAGRVARAERVAGAADLPVALQQSWDLLIADDRHPELDIDTVLQQWRAAEADFAAIVQRADADLAALFAAGASEVVAPEEDQRLIGAALRELETAELRRQVRRLQTQLREAEQRNALLLGEADQAIAYVTDGMVINANPLFAQRFGYADAGDMDCLPVIDLIAAADHEAFKALLKDGASSGMPFTGQRADGETFTALLRRHGATYDGEPCIQLIVEQADAPAGAVDGGRDADTGLYSRAWLLEHVNGGCLLLIGIDRFPELRRQLGLGASAQLLAGLGALIRERAPADSCLARPGDDCLGLLLRADTGQALDFARQLCAAVEGHIFELSSQSRQCTVSIGIAACGAGAALDTLEHAFAACEKVRDDAGNGVAVHADARPAIAADAGWDLESALAEQRFALLFQPIISLRGAGGEHYEVLLRMRGDTDALELPDNFLDAAGVSADNARLDRWILLEATKRLADNRAAGNDTRLVINLTANALQDETLATWLGVALKAAGLPGSTLILQLREIDVVNYLKPAKTFFEAVRQLGCRVSIGGFGGGLDPLKTLRNTPADWVQLDGSYTRALQTGGDTQALKELVSAIGGQDVRVIIPFVENAQVLAILWQVGADFIQGHYLQAPSRDMNYEFTDIA